jgi:divalent metal cation (Fe/Co/Zn/Cd) transporter
LYYGLAFLALTAVRIRRAARATTANTSGPRWAAPPVGAARLGGMRVPVDTAYAALLLRRGRLLEAATLSWNIIGIVILAIAALRAHSVALAGFGLDSLIEIGASTVVLWELSGAGEERQRRALRLIAAAFLALATYLTFQTIIVFDTGYHPQHSPLGIAWTAITAAAMFALAAGKKRTGRALGNPVLTTEGRVTVIDGLLACAVLLGLTLNATLGWWWADPAAGLVIVYYAVKEARTIHADH